MSAGLSTVQAVGIAGAVALVGLAVFFRLPEGPVAQTPEVVEPAGDVAEAETKAGLTEDPDVMAESVSTPPDAPVLPDGPILPKLDVVRIDASGAAVVAGSAGASADVILRLDGKEVSATRSDTGGNFVSLFDIGAAQTPRILTVETRDAEGTVARAEESVIVAPAAPVVAALEVPDAVIEAPVETRPATAPRAVVAAEDDAPRIASDVTQTDAPAVQAAPEVTSPPSAVPPREAASVAVIAPPATASAPTIPDTARVETPTSQPAPTAPRIFRAGPEGITVLADGGNAPNVTETLGIDAITYDLEGEVQLAGRGERDAQLRIYLNNQPVQLAQVDQGGSWTSPLLNVDTGIYTLRIDELADDGSVVRRIETPFQRTAPEIAAAARANGVSALTVQPGWTLWAISEGYFGDGVRYVQIFEANRDVIRDPDLIFPGQVFALPENEGDAG